VLGYRSSLPRDLYEVFAATGTLHVFAISGLHIGIVASFITCVLRLLRVPKTRWIFYVIPLIVGYTIATGARTSSVRACVMALIYFLSFFLGRRNDTISSLSLAAIVILLWDPSQIFDRGFIYSFIVVLGLVALTPFFFGLMLGSPDDDMDFVEAQLWRIKLKRRFLVILRSLIAMSVSAWLVSAPLTALFFGKFVPVSVLANLFVVPMVSVIAVTGFLSIVFGASIGGLVSFGLNWVNVGFVTVLERILSLLVSLPFASIEINRPAWYFVAVWYVLLMVIGNFSQSTQRKRVF